MAHEHHPNDRRATQRDPDAERERYAREHPAGALLSQRAGGPQGERLGAMEHERGAWGVPYQEQSLSMRGVHPLHGGTPLRADGREHRGHPRTDDEAGYGAQGTLLPGGGEHPYELGRDTRPVARMPKNYVRPDERIYEDIWERLMRLSELELDEVTIDVAGGNVSVTGSVPDRFSRYVIEEVCAGTFGVHDVTIQLAIH